MSTRYIPTGSEVVVQSAGGNQGQPRWYRTQKDVEITVDPTEAICPIRAGLPVLKITFQGFDVFFLDHQISYRASDEEIAHAQALQFHVLDYDVPSRLPDVPEAENFEHPSQWLRRIAAWSSGSCWIIPESQIPYTRLNQMSRVGVRWGSRKMDSSEAVKMLEEAIASMNREIQSAAVSAQNSQQSAERLLTNAAPDADPEKVRRSYIYRTTQIAKTARRRIDDVVTAAGVFGVTNRIVTRQAAQAMVQTVESAMQQRARLFADAVATARQSNTSDGAAVATAAEQNQMPAGILADYLQDQGHDDQAESLRTAFGTVPVQPQTDDSETFSLVGVGNDEPATV